MMALLLSLLLFAAAGTAGAPAGEFFESFDRGWEARWHYSRHKKYTGCFNSTVRPSSRGQDTAITIPTPNQRYAMAALLPRPLAPADGGLVLQYEAQFTETHGCGGAYLKLIAHTDGWEPRRLGRKTEYCVMFGPDRCGAAARVHFIIKALNPTTGRVVEHHLASPPPPPNDKLPHVYTLELREDGDRFRVLIDGEERAAGRFTDAAAFDPPLRPPREIPDPADAKPEGWDDREEIDDPDAVKPAGWDNRRMIPDEDAVMPKGWLEDEPSHLFDEAATRPDGWDEAADGVWMPPQIANPKCANVPGCGPWPRPYKRNPKYKGVWLPPRIPNPKYQGEWQPRSIPNPAFFEEATSPLRRVAPAGAVAFELMTIDKGYLFDGVLVAQAAGGGLERAEAYRRDVWRRRYWGEYAIAEAAHRQQQIAAVPAPARWIMTAFEAPPLSKLRGAAVPLLERLYESPRLAYPLLLAPLAIAAALGSAAGVVAGALRGEGGGGGGAQGGKAVAAASGRRRVAVAVAEEEEEDEGSDGSEGEEGEQGGAAGASERAGSAAKKD